MNSEPLPRSSCPTEDPPQNPHKPAPEIAPARVFESLATIAFAVDADARIVCASAGLERFTGLARETLIGRCYIELLVPAAEHQRARENLQRQLTGRSGAERERLVCDHAGNKRIVRWAESIAEDEHGRRLAVFCGMDVTERLRDEREREQQNQMLFAMLEESLKVDRSFVSRLDSDEKSLVLTKSIVLIGKTLGMKLMAEGVETSAQLARLTEMGCDFIQGYLISKPVPAGDFVELLLRNQKMHAVASGC